MSLKLELAKTAEIRAIVGEADPDLLHDMIDGETDLFLVIDWLLEKEADENALQAAIMTRMEALQTRKAQSSTRQQSLRAAILMALDASGQKSLRRPEATISVRIVPPGIGHIDEAVLPESFWKVTRSVSRSTISDALKAGEEVPGVLLDNGGVALSVRRK